MEAHVSSGFPSPAEDYDEPDLDLHELVVKNPPATFFMRTDTDTMRKTGVEPGDLLVVDRSLQAREGTLVVLLHDGDFEVKRCVMCHGRLVVADDHGSINVVPESLWGVVTFVVRQVYNVR